MRGKVCSLRRFTLTLVLSRQGRGEYTLPVDIGLLSLHKLEQDAVRLLWVYERAARSFDDLHSICFKVSRSLFAVVNRNSDEVDSLTSTTQRSAYGGLRSQWFDQFEEPTALI